MLETRLAQRIQAKKSQLDGLRPLPAAAVRRLNEQLTIEWIYNSNAIEGSTLSLRETQLILEQGITIGGKSLREHFEVINHQEAIKLVESLAGQQEPLTPFYVRQLHALVLAKIDDENAGQYRRMPEDTRVFDYACAENNRNPVTETGETLTLGPDGRPLDRAASGEEGNP